MVVRQSEVWQCCVLSFFIGREDFSWCGVIKYLLFNWARCAEPQMPCFNSSFAFDAEHECFQHWHLFSASTQNKCSSYQRDSQLQRVGCFMVDWHCPRFTFSVLSSFPALPRCPPAVLSILAVSAEGKTLRCRSVVCAPMTLATTPAWLRTRWDKKTWPVSSACRSVSNL